MVDKPSEDKLLVIVAPCIPPYMRAGLQGLDVSPQGVADEVVRAYRAGANVAHLHVWDEQGTPTTDLTAFELTLRLIRERCDIIIEGSTGGFNDLTPADRCVSLQTPVDMASLNPGSVNYDQGVYINSPSDVRYWAQEMKRRAIKPDIAIFEAGMIQNTLDLVDEGLVVPPLLFSFVLGQKGALPYSPKNLLFLVESVPAKSLWCVVGHGGHDLQASALAMNAGGHLRAGFEDNSCYRPGKQAMSNAELIERLVRIARELGREPASPAEARRILGLPVPTAIEAQP